MQHITKAQSEAVIGTSLQGYTECEYAVLKKLFGTPDDGEGYKVDAEWILNTPYGVATIYNYKDGKNYCGASGTPKTKITDWHIGGANKQVVPFIQSIIEAYYLGNNN